MGTIGGARVLGREDELGSLERGKLADVALWRVDGLAHAGCEDPVAALVLGSRPPLARAPRRGDHGRRGRRVLRDDADEPAWPDGRRRPPGALLARSAR